MRGWDEDLTPEGLYAAVGSSRGLGGGLQKAYLGPGGTEHPRSEKGSGIPQTWV